MNKNTWEIKFLSSAECYKKMGRVDVTWADTSVKIIYTPSHESQLAKVKQMKYFGRSINLNKNMFRLLRLLLCFSTLFCSYNVAASFLLFVIIKKNWVEFVSWSNIHIQYYVKFIRIPFSSFTISLRYSVYFLSFWDCVSFEITFRWFVYQS